MIEDITQPHIQGFHDSQAQIKASFCLSSEGSEIKYDPSGNYAAVCTLKGNISLYSCHNHNLTSQFNDPDQIPMTCLKWRPYHIEEKIIGVGSAIGHFSLIEVPSMKNLLTIYESKNQIMCCDFDGEGKQFATGGQDSQIRVYDESTKHRKVLLEKADTNYSGHSNKIFSIKFADKNTLISGGWDKTVHVWDLRQKKTVAEICGLNIEGDSIDYRENEILVGCYQTERPLNILDLKTLKPKQVITWGTEKAMVNSCSFHPFDKKCIIASAFGPDEVRIFNGEKKHSTGIRIFDIKDGCYSVAGHPFKKQIAISTAKKNLFVLSYDIK